MTEEKKTESKWEQFQEWFKSCNKEALCIGIVLAMCFAISIPFACGLIAGAVARSIYNNS